MALSTRVLSMLRRWASKGDVYALGIIEAMKGEAGSNVSQTNTRVFKNLAAASTTNCVAATAANAANTLVIAGQPSVPRNILATFAGSYDGGDITITGVDQTGAVVTETLATNAGSTRAGVIAFASVRSVTKAAVGATANTVSLGYSTAIGVGLKPILDGSLIGFMNGATTTFSATDLTNGTVTWNTAPDAGNDYIVMASKA